MADDDKNDDKQRVRLTEESISGIKVATTATTEKSSDGIRVIIMNEYGSHTLQNGTGDALYDTVSAAKKAVERHNALVQFVKNEVPPPQSMRPPTDAP